MLIFIDESGDHNLSMIDHQYPIFALGALLISEEEYITMDQKIFKLKSKFFDDDGTFILHSSELKRPLNTLSDGRNKCMLDKTVRKKFYKAADEVMESLNFKVIACIIKKKVMADKYRYPIDPYYFSFENLLNRIVKYGDDHNLIYAEKRGLELDPALTAEYERLCKIGIHSFSAKDVSERTKLTLVHKKENMNGLQVIDLILSCLVRDWQGKREKMYENDLSPSIIKQKLACPITLFPK